MFDGLAAAAAAAVAATCCYFFCFYTVIIAVVGVVVDRLQLRPLLLSAAPALSKTIIDSHGCQKLAIPSVAFDG